jgi:TonB family protein
MDRLVGERAGMSLSLVSSIPRPIGRFSVVLLFGVLCLNFGETAHPAGEANNKLFVFDGKIQWVDPAARTFTLQINERSYVFVVTDQTKIVRKGKTQQFADLKQGQPAEVEMKIGPGGKGMAVLIQLGFSSRESSSSVRASQLESLFAATTPDGKTISGRDVGRLVVQWPVFPTLPSIESGPFKTGVFLLSVRPDGTVSNVEMLHSTGYDRLDKRATQSMKEMRFRLNSVMQVRVPVQFSRQRYF